jgi:hypothetical protein
MTLVKNDFNPWVVIFELNIKIIQFSIDLSLASTDLLAVSQSLKGKA